MARFPTTARHHAIARLFENGELSNVADLIDAALVRESQGTRVPHPPTFPRNKYWAPTKNFDRNTTSYDAPGGWPTYVKHG